MNVIELLQDTQNLLRNPKNWCKDHYSVSYPNPEGGDGMTATMYCTLGGLIHIDPGGTLLERATQYLVAAKCGTTKLPKSYLCSNSLSTLVARHNDNRLTTHKDLMAWFDRAIALAQNLEGVEPCSMTDSGQIPANFLSTKQSVPVAETAGR